MNILHISDIHFGRNYPIYGLKDPFEKHDQILDELIEAIAGIDEFLRPEHIVFTGDIAWRGRTTEFKEAAKWFKRLLDALDLTGKDITFCVGNHDVDRSCQCDDPEVNNYTIDKIDEYYKYENIEKLEFPLYGYNEFCKEMGVEPFSYPVGDEIRYSYSAGFKDVTFSNGKKVRLVGFNTSMLITFKGTTSDKMWIGQKQIQSLIEYGILPTSDDIWYTIALCHHSDRFLHPDETSTYNGRQATLPLLMENVNLVLCGHTESAGKPRLSKQLGGGQILCGGAAYYSDEHINTFSMIYLSEKKRTMGFLPYVYEDGWKDYDFEQSSFYKDENKLIKDTEEALRDVTLLFEADDEKFQIDCRYLTFHQYQADNNVHARFCNNKDLMNPFDITYDSMASGACVHVTIASECSCSAKAHISYRKYVEFVKNSAAAETTKCRLIDSEGNEIFVVNQFTAKDECRYDDRFLQEIHQLEEDYDVRFKLPETLSKDDLKKIKLLKKMAVDGYAENAILSGEVKKIMSLEEMQNVYDVVCEENKFIIKSKKTFCIQLFDMSISLRNTTILAAPFYIDKNNIKYKIDTFCEGDMRECTFIPDIDMGVYIICDWKYEELMKQPEFSMLEGAQNIEDIDLTIYF